MSSSSVRGSGGGDGAEEISKSSSAKKKEAVGAGIRKGLTIALCVILIAAFAVPSVSSLAACSISTSSQEDSTGDETYQALAESAEATIAENPDDTSAVLNLAGIYYEWAMGVLQGTITSDYTSDELFALAAEEYEAYLSDGTVDADASTDLAMCLYYTGDYETAREVLETAVESTPDNAMAWARLGMIRNVLEDDDGAIEAFNTAMELDPDDETGAYSLASGQLALLEE